MQIAKEDIQIRIFEEQNGQCTWETYADFQPSQVHKQTAIWFKTPRYRTYDITEPADCFIQLKRPSDGATSEPLPFHYLPLDSGRPAFWSFRRTWSKKGTLFDAILEQDEKLLAKRSGKLKNDTSGFGIKLADLKNREVGGNNVDVYNAEVNNAELNNAKVNNAEVYNAEVNNTEVINAKVNNAQVYNADLNPEVSHNIVSIGLGSTHEVASDKIEGNTKITEDMKNNESTSINSKIISIKIIKDNLVNEAKSSRMNEMNKENIKGSNNTVHIIDNQIVKPRHTHIQLSQDSQSNTLMEIDPNESDCIMLDSPMDSGFMSSANILSNSSSNILSNMDTSNNEYINNNNNNEEKAFNDLITQVVELDEIYSDTQARLLSSDNIILDSSAGNDSFDDSKTYSSLQLAFKNPLHIIDSKYEDISPPDILPPEISPNKREIVEEKLPPLPPKRTRKMETLIGGSRTSLNQDFGRTNINLSKTNLSNISSQNVSNQNNSNQNLSNQNISSQNLNKNLSSQNLSNQHLSNQNLSKKVSNENVSNSTQNVSNVNFPNQNITNSESIPSKNFSNQNISSSQNLDPIHNSNLDMPRSQSFSLHRPKSQNDLDVPNKKLPPTPTSTLPNPKKRGFFSKIFSRKKTPAPSRETSQGPPSKRNSVGSTSLQVKTTNVSRSPSNVSAKSNASSVRIRLRDSPTESLQDLKNENAFGLNNLNDAGMNDRKLNQDNRRINQNEGDVDQNDLKLTKNEESDQLGNKISLNVNVSSPNSDNLDLSKPLMSNYDPDDVFMNLDLTEAEHYALYTTFAPHATQSEFDETSCYYAPVEGGKIFENSEVSYQFPNNSQT